MDAEYKQNAPREIEAGSDAVELQAAQEDLVDRRADAAIKYKKS
jgi:2,4-dienoyl-CoA reductase-like NADH-dependent reductase (Old Yellow Enzyme family)